MESNKEKPQKWRDLQGSVRKAVQYLASLHVRVSHQADTGHNM